MLYDNPEYVHPERNFWMPTDDADDWLPKNNHEEKPLVIVESPAPDIVPATSTCDRSCSWTATGRAARGELEAWVKEQCDIWLVDCGQMEM